jgi:phosphatidylglycerophosphatase A
MKDWKTWLAKAFATCGFLGYLPLLLNSTQSSLSGAGFIGTLVGVFTVRWLPLTGAGGVIVLTGAFLFSVAVSDYAEQFLRRKDDPRIIIDEWVGYWIAMAYLPQTWKYLLAAFVLFRILDVWKPLGIRKLSHWPGGWGVVMDDIAAGLIANVILQLAQLLRGPLRH